MYSCCEWDEMVLLSGGSIWAGYPVPYDEFVFGVTVGQKYMMQSTAFGGYSSLNPMRRYITLSLRHLRLD